MMQILRSFTLLGLGFLFGCNGQRTDSSAPVGAVSDDVNSPTEVNSGSENPKDADQAPSVILSEPPESEIAADGANSTIDATGPTQESALDPLIRGLEFPNVDIREVFTTQKAAYEKSPTDPEAATKFIGLVQTLGEFHEEQGNRETAMAAFRQTLEMLDQATASGISLDPQLTSSVYFRNAVMLSREGRADEAQISFRKAVTGDLNEQRIQELLEAAKTSEDLSAVRALPSFADQLAKWEADLKARTIEHAKSDLVNGESFPFDFSLTDVHGNALRLADHRGKVCIVDVWGTWCGPCIKEIPSFIQLQQKFGSAGFQIMGLNEENSDGPEKVVADYIGKSGINYPCALMVDEVQAQIPQFDGYPTTLFVDRYGKVRLKLTGWHDYIYLEAIVEALLAEEPPATPNP